MILTDCKLLAKKVVIILQTTLFIGIEDKYLSLVSNIELEYILKKSDLTNNILRFIRFAKIQKENDKIRSFVQASTLFITKLTSKIGEN